MSSRRLLVAVICGLGTGSLFRLNDLFSRAVINNDLSQHQEASWRAHQDRIDRCAAPSLHQQPVPRRAYGFAPPQRPAKRKGHLRTPGKFY